MLCLLGLDHHRAHLETRERFHLGDEDADRLREALARRGVEEVVIARTCNRIEVYAWLPPSSPLAADPARVLGSAWVDDEAVELEQLLLNARLRHGSDAVRHLFRVCSGLESQVLGDIHILGQLRRAFQQASSAGSVGSRSYRLFENALRVGKQVRRETSLMATRSGVGSTAAARAVAHCGDLGDTTCLVVGCGKSGTDAARWLSAQGATEIIVANRTLERAQRLASDLAGTRAVGLDALDAELPRADVVVVSTGARSPVLTREVLGRALARRSDLRKQPLLVIDVSVPRNVEAAAGRLEAVELVDLDNLHPEAAKVEKARRTSVPAAEEIVERAVAEYEDWLALEAARRSLRPLQGLLSEICRKEIDHLAGGSASARRTADRIVAAVMARPMSAMRAARERGERLEESASALGALFVPPCGSKSP